MKKAPTNATTAVKKTTTTTTSSTAAKTTTTVNKPAGTSTAAKSTTTAVKTTTTASKTGTSATKSTAASTKTKTDTKTAVKKTTKTEEKKVENKEVKQEVKQEEKVAEIPQVEQKKEEQKVQQEEIIIGEVTITYNHYKNKFPIKNGQVTSTIIDDEYCMSAVFLGNFKMHLLDDTKKRVEEKIGSDNVTTFSGLVSGKSYGLQIEEDDAAEAQRESKAFVADKKEDKLRGERKEGCSCLFGNPCVDSGVCNDWKNRYDVAKKNGWKGFQ